MAESSPRRFLQQTVPRTSKFHRNFFVLLLWFLSAKFEVEISSGNKLMEFKGKTKKIHHSYRSRYSTKAISE